MGRQVLFAARVRGAQAVGHDLRTAARKLPVDLQVALEKTGQEGLTVFAVYAPRDTTRLIRDLHVDVQGHRVNIVTDPVDPESGYHYIAVTRFGHKRAWIYPRRAKKLEIGRAHV